MNKQLLILTFGLLCVNAAFGTKDTKEAKQEPSIEELQKKGGNSFEKESVARDLGFKFLPNVQDLFEGNRLSLNEGDSIVITQADKTNVSLSIDKNEIKVVCEGTSVEEQNDELMRIKINETIRLLNRNGHYRDSTYWEKNSNNKWGWNYLVSYFLNPSAELISPFYSFAKKIDDMDIKNIKNETEQINKKAKNISYMMPGIKFVGGLTLAVAGVLFLNKTKTGHNVTHTPYHFLNVVNKYLIKLIPTYIACTGFAQGLRTKQSKQAISELNLYKESFEFANNNNVARRAVYEYAFETALSQANIMKTN